MRYYYFLKQVDVDNHKVNSAPKSAIISENKLANVSIHPNPASDNLMVNFGSVLVSGLHINMFDMAGKLVRVQTIGAVAPDENIQLDVSSLSTGMYMLQLITSESTQSVKFVKQ